ncbi:MAG: septum formation protein Maf, partial [Gammaproteobacteria bacterium]|nr:septum formation protein Maf [Gammaproteobacteria bacterium]
MLIHLATRSPRRHELLSQIGVPHNQLEVHVDEIPMADEAPSEYVIRLALAKAQAGRAITHDLPVLGADTAVVIDNKIMGKPKSSEQAFTMMRRLSGRTHKVLTGVALIYDKPESRLSVSSVTFRSVTPAEIQAYWHSG